MVLNQVKNKKYTQTRMAHLFLYCFLILFCSKISSASFNPEDIQPLQGIRFHDRMGLIRKTFVITIPHFPHVYNPSIIPWGNEYLLAFRCDEASNTLKQLNNIRSAIGLVRLDKNFKPISASQLLDTKNHCSEDPRLFATTNAVYMSYSHVHSFNPAATSIAVSKIDVTQQKVVTCTDLRYNTAPVEKNWTPFVYKNPKGVEELYFVYKFYPHRILRLSPAIDGTTTIAYDHGENRKRQLKRWQKKWGKIRGGTPAIRIGDDYLCFFHSAFRYKQVYYYVFGAITFEASPPFRLKKISNSPILFKEMYSIPVTPQHWFYPRHHIRVIFPSGIIQRKEDARDLLYVVCGENDVAIRCVVIDQKLLLASLISVE